MLYIICDRTAVTGGSDWLNLNYNRTAETEFKFGQSANQIGAVITDHGIRVLQDSTVFGNKATCYSYCMHLTPWLCHVYI